VGFTQHQRQTKKPGNLAGPLAAIVVRSILTYPKPQSQ